MRETRPTVARVERYVASLVLGAFFALSLLLLPPAAFAAYAGANGEVIFQSSRDGDNEIYLLNPDGTGVTKLTDNTASDVNPTWSPDGQRIAFQSNRDGDAEVWVMDADGTDQVALTNDPAFDGAPSWSPDGTRIAFTSARDGDDEIFAMNAGGGSEGQLTFNGATDKDPAYGNVFACVPVCETTGRIAFTSDRDGNEEIYAMYDDGSDQTNLTANSAADSEASWWLPAGSTRRLAFVSDRGLAPGDSDLDIWEMSGDGLGVSSITDDPVDEVAPAWSPDGERIAYERVGNDREIYVADRSGLNPANITNAATNERAPDWKAVLFSNPPYIRPKGATPLRASLVLAYPQCAAPNRTHGPPLAFGSCAPPTPSSPNVNIGVPEGGGAAANMIGSVRLDVVVGLPGPPDDSDVAIDASITDVRCDLRDINIHPFPCGAPNVAQQNDYIGALQASLSVELTDRWNATVPAGGGDRATSVVSAHEVTIPCQATASTSIGGHCSVSTTFNALAPGAVRDGKRAVWALGPVRVYDAGPDGTVGNGDGRELFATQGVIVP